MKDSVSTAGDPGAPEAAALAVRHLREHVDPERVRRIWFFPPLRQGRRETGLLAASLALPASTPGDEGSVEARDGGSAEARDGGAGEEERRLLVTVRYAAQETGKGTRFEPLLREEGEAPPDRIPRVIHGVLRRSDAGPGEPVEVAVDGDPGVLAELAGDAHRDPEEDAGRSAGDEPAGGGVSGVAEPPGPAAGAHGTAAGEGKQP